MADPAPSQLERSPAEAPSKETGLSILAADLAIGQKAELVSNQEDASFASDATTTSLGLSEELSDRLPEDKDDGMVAATPAEFKPFEAAVLPVDAEESDALAALALDVPSSEEAEWQPEPLPNALLRALESERLGLATAVAEVTAVGEVPELLKAALPLVAMAMVADTSGEFDDRARDATRHALDALPEAPVGDTTRLALVLLLPAATTLALLAPGSGQASLLAAMLGNGGNDPGHADSLPRLRDLAQEMYQGRHVAGTALISASALMAGLVTEEAWRQELDAASNDIAAWARQQLARSIRYAAATDVWREMLRPGGTFYAHLQVAAQAATGRAEEVRRFVTTIDIDREIRQVERQVRGLNPARRSPISGPAYRELHDAVEEAVHHLRHWLSIVERAPSRAERSRTKPIADLRARLLSRIRAAEEELLRLDGLLAAGVPCGTAALRRLMSVLEGATLRRAAPSLDALLGRDLVGVPGIVFGAGWSRQHPPLEEVREELFALAQAPAPPPLAQSARRRIAAGDYLGAELVIELTGDAEERPVLQRELRNALERRKADEAQALDEKHTKVEEAERAGRLDAGLAHELTERLLRVREQVAAAVPASAAELFAEARRHVALADAKLSERAVLARDRITLRLDQLRQLPEPNRDRVEGLLEAGQFALAEDLVERLEAGEPLDPDVPVPVEEAFAAFFPAGAERLAGWLRGRRTAMRDIADGTCAVPQDLFAPGQELTADLPTLAEAWADCVRENSRNALQDALLRLFAAFGFTDPELPGFATPARKVSEAVLQLRVRALRDRDTAVLPQFGSEAEGTYRLLCLWHKRDAEDIAQALAALPVSSAPTIVLFFGPLDHEQRRRLAALARADRLRSTIVVDEVLALHLGLLPRGRLMALFACTLPFTDSRPWADTGTPAPEMFFGRARELRAVTARSGEFTHLLYGGRQLGKTAVLRQVERSTAADPDTVARYVSIAEIGLQQPPAELWPRLAEELARAGIAVPRASGAQGVRTAVREWLDKRPGRQMLMLLDEADAFFEKDRQAGFTVTSALRDLTVDTDRRFKPVFAGLRNVQKLARDPNSPIAHLGAPLVVGPLLRGEERRQAESLVRWPFTALGYHLDEAVVSRILAFANYYPSLIQVVCQRLLRSLRQQSGSGGPPWMVRMEDVERVLETPEVRTAAFERFRITLELDPRYNLLTLLMANFSMDEPELLASGIDGTMLRALAADAWPSGFPATFADDAFEALLDEMVGLGLLRGVTGAHYALRSANLAHLIGSPGEIRRQLESFASRPAPAISDPLEMRRMIGGRPGLLTARQEGHLLAPGSGVAILAGTVLSGVGNWRTAVDTACRIARERHGRDVNARVLGGPFGLDHFRAALAKTRSTGSTLHLVPPAAPWDAAWVEEAVRRVRAAAKGAASLPVLFLADAQRAWEWVADPRRTAVLDEGDPASRVVELTAGPWSLDDVNLWANDAPLRLPGDAIMRVTGGWDLLIRQLEALPPAGRAAPAAELARSLLDPGSNGDPLEDLRALPEVAETLRALGDCQDGRLDGEVVEAA
ncbi:hypothetical protein EAH89_17470 [Roseomonas nepalensis]|uniref:Uncharacterized protein n=1 Tax=Muricoccus nepalensis TaxID=1854500 RepID=A0A502FUP3_9PROT|nr:hypothetical protein [Roseomonas nepalensis]TPG53110.1 hypothetical protein EAH89_17470 [Roseomonas nepalensis]